MGSFFFKRKPKIEALHIEYVKEIEENAFAYEMTLIVTEGSYAEEYVKKQGYTYRLK